MRRTGVIIGVSAPLSVESATRMMELLRERFPGVEFAIVDSGIYSVAFEWEDKAAGVTP